MHVHVQTLICRSIDLISPFLFVGEINEKITTHTETEKFRYVIFLSLPSTAYISVFKHFFSLSNLQLGEIYENSKNIFIGHMFPTNSLTEYLME